MQGPRSLLAGGGAPGEGVADSCVELGPEGRPGGSLLCPVPSLV